MRGRANMERPTPQIEPNAYLILANAKAYLARMYYDGDGPWCGEWESKADGDAYRLLGECQRKVIFG